MRRTLALLVLLAILTLSLTGCWDYRSLNNMSMVMGMSIDRDEETGVFKIAFEIADLASASKDGGLGAQLVEVEGTTVFDAVRNAKRMLLNKLYFAHMSVIVIGEKLAREFGLQPVIDWFQRDAEVRETTAILIAKGTDAHSILLAEAIDQVIVSPEIQGILMEDNKVTSSIVYMKLFEVYSVLNCTGVSLTLPAFHVTQNDEKQVVEADGAAIFNGSKLVGFLSAEETKLFLLAQGKAKGGIITISASGSGTDDTSLEIVDTKSDISYQYKDGVIKFRVETTTDVLLAETMCEVDVLVEEEIRNIERIAGERIATGIAGMIGKVQKLYGDDILGFGAILHEKDSKLWHTIEKDWASLYPDITVEVASKVIIRNTATIRGRKGHNQ